MASESRSFTTTPAIAEIWTRDSLARRVVERLLPSLQAGRLQIALPSGEVIDRRTDQPGPEALITLNRWRALWRLMRDGDIGLGRGYLDGDWWTPNLGALLELGMRNEAALAASAGGWRTRLAACAIAGAQIRAGPAGATSRRIMISVTRSTAIGSIVG